jgi:hypothetical protein
MEVDYQVCSHMRPEWNKAGRYEVGEPGATVPAVDLDDRIPLP